ncbi:MULTISPECIES: glycosyltransferase family 39 protein [Amylolactobacillus]|nr:MULTISPECIES: glycosyltransferase family 39 protein [Amylolactobacillus]APT18304.1 hypothetical protein LA20533_03025 [Amylolactobacillus amylophilus DSM 20533 = JCM 1125]GED80994.1 membrane protein [Amylolactobacillus amylophilus]
MRILRKVSNVFLLTVGSLGGVLIVLFSLLNLKKFGLANLDVVTTLFVIFYIGVSVGLYFIPNKRLVRVIVLATIVILAALIRYWWIKVANTVPESDFAVMYHAARDLASGHNLNVLKESGYFLAYPYQNGFVLYQALIMKVFGTSVFSLQLMNVLLGGLTIILLYFMVKLISNDRTAMIAMFMYAFYLPAILMTSVLTNQIVATLMYVAGFYLLIDGQKQLRDSWLGLMKLSFGALFILLGNIMRPLGPVILIAIVLYYLVYVLEYRKKFFSGNIKSLLAIVVILVIYFVGMFAAGAGIKASGVSDYGLVNRDPMWKFVTGLNSESRGHYSTEALAELNKEPIGVKRDALGKRIIKSELKNGNVLKLFLVKYKSMWSDNDSSMRWSANNPNVQVNVTTLNGKLVIRRIELAQKIQWIFIFMLLVIALVMMFKSADIMLNKNSFVMLLIILIFGYIAVHLLIEIQTRYRFFIIPFIISMGAIGLSSLLGKVDQEKAQDISIVK